MFDLVTLKQSIRDTLRTYCYPQCLEGTIETALSAMVGGNTINYDIAQSFIPYNQCFTRQEPYNYDLPITLKLKKYGTPDGDIEVAIVTDANGYPSEKSTISLNTIPASFITTEFSEVTQELNLTSLLGSHTKYWIKIIPKNTPSTINYYALARNDVDTVYLKGTSVRKQQDTASWSTLSCDIYFKVKTKNWIYEHYPHERLSIHNYPRVAIDFVGRPRVIQRYIDHKVAEYHLTLLCTIYSRYPDELDDLISFIDQILFNKRIEISDFIILNPIGWTDITQVRGLFVRGLTYNCRYKMTTT